MFGVGADPPLHTRCMAPAERGGTHRGGSGSSGGSRLPLSNYCGDSKNQNVDVNKKKEIRRPDVSCLLALFRRGALNLDGVFSEKCFGLVYCFWSCVLQRFPASSTKDDPDPLPESPESPRLALPSRQIVSSTLSLVFPRTVKNTKSGTEGKGKEIPGCQSQRGSNRAYRTDNNEMRTVSRYSEPRGVRYDYYRSGSGSFISSFTLNRNHNSACRWLAIKLVPDAPFSAESEAFFTFSGNKCNSDADELICSLIKHADGKRR
ncbi:hypothetical protein EYF80_030198 [Liparis tanakae]|uniref:Uncharacterized protein n=1 Tax=Liparis tanakae TaxID=230148 RepID=A0A4Z2H123_9TELE|nr:hypothetical protein EYF80_030198 [Liparis tanakae]